VVFWRQRGGAKEATVRFSAPGVCIQVAATMVHSPSGATLLNGSRLFCQALDSCSLGIPELTRTSG